VVTVSEYGQRGAVYAGVREGGIENSRNRKCNDVTGAPHYCDFNALHGMLVIFNKSPGTYFTNFQNRFCKLEYIQQGEKGVGIHGNGVAQCQIITTASVSFIVQILRYQQEFLIL
jgi:hypothetical protein